MRQWNKIFKEYGKFFTKPQEDIPKIVKLFREKGVKKALDLGCGSGRHIVYLAKHGFEVYGIDIAPKGIGITKSWLKKEKLKARLKIGNIYKKLPYPNNFFDALISIQVLNHNRIGNIRKLIKEIERILKPEGLIFITVSRRGSIKDIPKEKLWKIRRVMGEAVKSQSIYKEEDTVVPRAELPKLLKGVKEIGAKYGFKSVCYGHAGDGNLHVNIIKDNMSDEAWNNELPQGIAEIFLLCVQLKGTISGEHGIGYVQKLYMNIPFGEKMLSLQKQIKSVFDPNNILNPSKMFP